MENITLSIPKETKEKIKKHKEINWSEIIRQALNQKINEIEKINKIIKDEKEISEWATKLQRKSRKDREKELKKKGLI